MLILIYLLAPPLPEMKLNYAQQKVFATETCESNTQLLCEASRGCLCPCLCVKEHSGRAKIEADAVATNMQHTLRHCIIWQQISVSVRARHRASILKSLSSSFCLAHKLCNSCSTFSTVFQFACVCVCVLNADAIAYA